MMSDLVNMLPMLCPIVKLELSGAQLKSVLENGVSKYPAAEGRFAQVCARVCARCGRAGGTAA
jgi:5'-nucleotidase, C-terminal domain